MREQLALQVRAWVVSMTLIARACTASVCKFSNSISALLLGGSAKAGSTLTNIGIQKFSTVLL